MNPSNTGPRAPDRDGTAATTAGASTTMHTRFTAKPGAESQVAALLADYVPHVRAKHGNIACDSYRLVGVPDNFLLHEVYRHQGAVTSHLNSDHRTRFHKAIAGLIVETAPAVTPLIALTTPAGPPAASGDKSGNQPSSSQTHSHGVYAASERRKPWGRERLFAAVEGAYVGKIIELAAHESVSLQHHTRKTESILVLSGRGKLELGRRIEELERVPVAEGDCAFIPAGTLHRITALHDLTFVEVSTAHPGWDTDVHRVEDKYGRSGTSTVAPSPSTPDTGPFASQLDR